jgi:hypothetical protein
MFAGWIIGTALQSACKNLLMGRAVLDVKRYRARFLKTPLCGAPRALRNSGRGKGFMLDGRRRAQNIWDRLPEVILLSTETWSIRLAGSKPSA